MSEPEFDSVNIRHTSGPVASPPDCEFGIELTRCLSIYDVPSRQQAWRMVITVTDHNNIDANIFVYLRVPPEGAGQDATDTFVAVATPNDLEELPVGAPGPACLYRMADVDLIARTRDQLDAAWNAIVADVTELIRTTANICELPDCDVTQFGTLSESSESSESSSAPIDPVDPILTSCEPDSVNALLVTQSNDPGFLVGTRFLLQSLDSSNERRFFFSSGVNGFQNMDISSAEGTQGFLTLSLVFQGTEPGPVADVFGVRIDQFQSFVYTIGGTKLKGYEHAPIAPLSPAYIRTQFDDITPPTATSLFGVHADASFVFIVGASATNLVISSYSVGVGGVLTLEDTDSTTLPVSGASNVFYDGQQLYVTNTAGIAVYDVDGAGLLTHRTTSALTFPAADLGAGLWFDGTFAYFGGTQASAVTSRLFVYEYDSVTNTLFQADSVALGTENPTSIWRDDDGRLYVAAGSDGLFIYTVDGVGVLTLVNYLASVPDHTTAEGVFGSNGILYLSGLNDNAVPIDQVTVFTVTSAGILTALQTHTGASVVSGPLWVSDAPVLASEDDLPGCSRSWRNYGLVLVPGADYLELDTSLVTNDYTLTEAGATPGFRASGGIADDYRALINYSRSSIPYTLQIEAL